MPARDSAASRLLTATLRPERARVARLVALLVVTMSLPLAGPLLLARFVDAAVSGEPMRHLTTLAVAYLVVALVRQALELAVVWASVGLSWRAGNHLREKLADHVLKLDLAWHGRHSPGVLIERIDGDITTLAKFFSTVVLHVIGNALLVVGIVAVSLFIDWRMAALLVATAAVSLATTIKLRAIAVDAHEADREASAILLGDLEERLGGLEDLRANGAGPYAVHRLQANSARYWRTSMRAELRGVSSWAGSAAGFSIGSVVTLGAAIVLYRRGEITVGSVLALFRYSEMLRRPLDRIAEQLKEFQKALAGARRAANLLATEPTIVDGPLGADALPPGALAVELDHVSFAYDGEHDVLHDVTLRLAPGTHLGLVGRTGSGKTSIGRLLLRFWDVQRGEVRVGGVDVRRLQLAALRGRTAVVTQDVELLRASVRDNLTMLGTRPAPDHRLLEVLDDVGLGSWLASLSDGLDTRLEGSASLSAGEAQLIAFARAFLAEPDLVVLDEASSRLDPVTEQHVSRATARLLQGRTAVIIAHRLATLEQVDEIAVLEHGRVVEHGPRTRLGADPASRYARLRVAGEVDDVVEESA